ncbi:MAG: hypothetical protein ACREHV_01030 [Rhizomicrobium sp.]
MALIFHRPDDRMPFDPADGCPIRPQRLFMLPDDLALRLAAHCAASGDDAEAVVLDLVELGLDEIEDEFLSAVPSAAANGRPASNPSGIGADEGTGSPARPSVVAP